MKLQYTIITNHLLGKFILLRLACICLLVGVIGITHIFLNDSQPVFILLALIIIVYEISFHKATHRNATPKQLAVFIERHFNVCGENAEKSFIMNKIFLDALTVITKTDDSERIKKIAHMALLNARVLIENGDQT